MELISREKLILDMMDRGVDHIQTRDLMEIGQVIAEQEVVNRWIPVSERLPKENRTVIASTEYGVYPEARYTKEYGWEWAYESGADYWKELEDVTAWMPLPIPYKPQESEQL